jgi:predicted nucleic acid-binding protein
VATEPLLYADSSALVKLIVEEPESAALRRQILNRDLVSSELVLAEVPRAIRRLAATTGARRPRLARGLEAVLEAVSLVPVEGEILRRAGAFDAPFLRTLDAIHLAAALDLADAIDGFVSYDERQIEAARIAGIPVLSPA